MEAVNKIKTTINGTDYTKKTLFSFKYGDLLDERLDEAYISLKNVKRKEPFQPNDEVTITIENNPKCKRNTTKPETKDIEQKVLDDNTLKQTTQRTYLVGGDSVNNYPVGSDLYTHDLYLIEETKASEGIILDGISFTNALANDFINTDNDETTGS